MMILTKRHCDPPFLSQIGFCSVLEVGSVGDGRWVNRCTRENRDTRSGWLRGVGGEGGWQWLLGE